MLWWHDTVSKIMPNTIIEKAKKLAALQARVAELQEELDGDRAEALANLPGQYGFDNADGLINAIRAAAGKRRGRRPGKASARKKYARITAETRAKIKAALKAGKTGAEVAAQYGISLPSVYNIKKAFGLVKSRKAPTKRARPKSKKRAKVAKPAAAEEKPADAK